MMAESIDAQFDRIKQVFGAGEIPAVSPSTIKIYFEHIQKNLICPCLLTGMESMGFFRWEERFSFGYGSADEYKQMRQENGSFQDTYELKEFDAVAYEWDIEVNVRRIPHYKKFRIPLSELKAQDKTSPNYQVLNDYSVWRVNW
ncbi:MAG: hypothetical protein WA821_01675 [Anaerolineales bacterium]